MFVSEKNCYDGGGRERVSECFRENGGSKRERERIDHKSRSGIVRIEERERGSERGLVH